ncbi:MAG: cyanoexosortase A [Acaryochloridaceae cyanobacterium RU_4_10]|nr:cyanoexosortase A [Acaryochloridaceae cyanobacterium RU_4_10]
MQTMQFLRALFTDNDRQNFRISFFCLLILACIHASLDIYLGKQAHLIVSIPLWSSIFLLLWDNKQDFKQTQEKISFLAGCLLLAALLVITVARPGEKLIGFFPLFAFLGWFLVFAGFSQFKTHLKELAILVAFGLPKLVSESAFGLAPLTANFSANILWHLGQSVSLQGVQINVPNGSVEVVPSCSGANLITHMLSVSVMVMCVLPKPQNAHRITLPLIAILLGFVMNGLRVALLALFSPPQYASLFHYWHGPNGASTIVLLTLLIYSLICFWLLKPLEQNS